LSTTLVKGQNMPLTTGNVTVTVEVAHPADLSALLVTASGKVRSDADFIFFNQPNGPGVTCRQPSAGQPWRVDLDLARVPADVEKVRVVTSLEGDGTRFGRFAPPTAKVSDASGTVLATFVMTGLDAESIVVAVEAYRRAGQWKLRAVGQGYAGGLADLVTDHGVTVDDPGPAAAPAAPQRPALPVHMSPPSGPVPTPPAPPVAPPQAPQYPPTAPMPTVASGPPAPHSAPPASGPPQAPGYPPQAPGVPPQAPTTGPIPTGPGPAGQYPPGYAPQSGPPTGQVPTAPMPTAPGQFPPPQAPGYPPQAPGYPPQAPGVPPQAPGYPPQAPGYPPQAPTTGQFPSAPPAGPPPGQMPSAPGQFPPPQAPGMPPQAPGAAPQQPAAPENVTPGRPVSLQKGQRISLSKQDGSQLTLVRMGLGWDPIKKRGLFGSREIEVDLDASAVMFADHQPVDIAFFNHLRSNDGSIVHTGDNRTGAGDGDDESIMVELPRVPAHVTTIFFVVTSYEGHTFQQIENAFCRLVDETTRGELARYTLSGGAPYTAMVMAKVYRDGATWKMQAVGEGAQGRTALDLVPHLVRLTY
jgi:stress response protein SCP2